VLNGSRVEYELVFSFLYHNREEDSFLILRVSWKLFAWRRVIKDSHHNGLIVAEDIVITAIAICLSIRFYAVAIQNDMCPSVLSQIVEYLCTCM